jgi:hypothetical protein
MDLSSDIGSLPVVGLLVDPFHEFETFVASKGISYVVIVSSQRDVNIACHS